MFRIIGPIYTAELSLVAIEITYKAACLALSNALAGSFRYVTFLRTEDIDKTPDLFAWLKKGRLSPYKSR